MKNISIGTPAPDFSLPDYAGETRSLSDYRGQWVLLYFYPKDNTPGCVKEACGIRDQFPHFVNRSVAVLGVSPDSAQSHKKFSEKYKLPFTLLADTEKKVVREYGVWGKKKMMGREVEGVIRTSFLIDPKGRVARIYDQVKPEGHAQEVLADLEALES